MLRVDNLSVSYGAGAALLRFKETGPEKIWSGDDILSNHYATSVAHDGFLYGFEGRQEQRCRLRCVELQTGRVRWSEDRFGAGTLLALFPGRRRNPLDPVSAPAPIEVTEPDPPADPAAEPAADQDQEVAP